MLLQRLAVFVLHSLRSPVRLPVLPAVSLPLIAALVSLATSAAAATDMPIVLTSYDVPHGCATISELEARIRRRVTRAPTGKPAPSFRVRIEATRSRGFRGRIAVVREDSTEAERTLDGKTCDEVVWAVALVAALSIEPEQARQDDEFSAARSSVEEPQAHSPEPTAADRAPPPFERPSVSPPPTASSRVRVSAGVDGAAQYGVAPETLLTIPIFAELAFKEPIAKSSLRARFAPSVRLAFVRGARDTDFGARGATFTWTAGQLDACFVGLDVGPASLTSCPRVELGMLAGEGRRILPTYISTRTWGALALPVRLRLAPARHFFFEVEAGPRVPLTRDRFVFAPNETAFQAPAVAWWAGAGAGVAFP